MFKKYFNIYSIVLLILIIILSIYAITIPKKQDQFSTIYLLNSNDTFGEYSGNITVGVKNNLGYGTQFIIFYKKEGTKIESWDVFVDNDQTNEFQVNIENQTGEIIFELWYKDRDEMITNSNNWVGLKL